MGQLIPVAGGSMFADYHHYADLASGASYTPTAKSMALFIAENGQIQSTEVNLELWDTAAWTCARDNLAKDPYIALNQDNAQNVRIQNDDPAAVKISLTGITWS